MLKETEKRVELLEQYIITTEVILAEQKTLKHNLKDEIIQNNIIMEETQIELNRITNKLNAIQINKFAVSKECEKLKTIRVLKDLFPEVYGRLFTLCKPIHERYNIAVTKVLWNFKDAIVVKTEKVAKKCIDYLKQQKIRIETFLPLDTLKIQSDSNQLRHNLRNMRNLQNVQLLYDVIEYFPKEISNAILFVTKNTLLCETSEDATRVAYEIHSDHRYSCVTLDGSYYQKSGLISGGSFDLSTKATVWKDKQTQEMKLQKATLIEKMKEVSKCSKKQSELSTINSEICSLTNKLKYSRVDLDNIKKQISNLETDIENINHQIISIVDNIESIQKIINKRQENIQNIENQINKVENRIFSIFCKNINVADIREYENGRLRIRGQHKKREMELENQYNCIKNALDLEIHHNTEDEMTKYKTAIQTAKEQLKIAFEEESAIADVINKQSNELQNLSHIHTNLKMEVIQMKNELALCRHQIGIITKLILETRREHTIIAIKIKKKKTESDSILKDCQMEDIIIPMSNQNTLNDSVWASSINTSSLNTIGQNEDNILSKINFSSLLHELQTINEDQFDNIKNKLVKNIDVIKHKLKLIPAPNLKANENLILVHEKLNIINKAVKDIRNIANIAKKKFTKVKEERINRFTKCFDYLTSHVDYIYKVRDIYFILT
ncbi:structural maintenance of chromosomes protein 1A-like [Polistes fuscatus]|uniref:structural maintenance of chromosomes protein 1A-like n=1 Tax=Polistes fuscatus TaxID=30207 RepID=UPI001CA89322|nr:structural maintenance of chromosomes protein 1A-like [Polistes fuscatus]